MADPIAIWRADHVRFARLLDLVERELAAFHDGGQPDYGLLLDIVHYLRHYPDRFHHPREDVAFTRLGHHLAAEEQQVVPRAGERLSPDDWAAVAAAAPVGPDPLFGDDSEARYRELRRQIAVEANHAPG
jgi:hemerythrin-like domain-containing protein